jgi:hypothetical protein
MEENAGIPIYRQFNFRIHFVQKLSRLKAIIRTNATNQVNFTTLPSASGFALSILPASSL